MPEHKSLEELEEEDGKLDVEISVARKKAMLKAVDAKMGQKGGWRILSSNGRLRGLNWDRVRNWLRTN